MTLSLSPRAGGALPAGAGNGFHLRRVLAAAAVAGLALAGTDGLARKRPAWELRWLPAPQMQKKPDPSLKIRGERATFRQRGIVVQVELLDERRRGLFLSSAGISSADPFATPTLGQHAWTFLLRLENTADEPLTFRPPAVSLYTKRPLSVTSPCDYLCLIDVAERAALGEDEQKKLLETVIDTAETLRSGNRVSKLLVFVGVPDSFKQFVLDVDGLVIGQNTLHFVLPYRAEKHVEKKAPDDRASSADDRMKGVP